MIELVAASVCFARIMWTEIMADAGMTWAGGGLIRGETVELWKDYQSNDWVLSRDNGRVTCIVFEGTGWLESPWGAGGPPKP